MSLCHWSVFIAHFLVTARVHFARFGFAVAELAVVSVFPSINLWRSLEVPNLLFGPLNFGVVAFRTRLENPFWTFNLLFGPFSTVPNWAFGTFIIVFAAPAFVSNLPF